MISPSAVTTGDQLAISFCLPMKPALGTGVVTAGFPPEFMRCCSQGPGHDGDGAYTRAEPAFPPTGSVRASVPWPPHTPAV